MDATRCLDDLDTDFHYRFANDSHSWLLDYPDKLKPDPDALKVSSKNETFVEHPIRRSTNKGKRKMLTEAFYRKVISEEILERFQNDGITVEEYVTDYTEKYKNPDDMPLPGENLSKNEQLKIDPNARSQSERSKLEELKVKYPLYLSTPLTFFSQATGRNHFRKNSTITKSPDENYDNIEY